MKYPMVYDEATKVATGDAFGATMLRKVILEHFKVGNYGIFSPRSARGKDKLSVHAEGRAWDAACNAHDPTQLAEGDRLADFLWSNREHLGVQKIIWNKREIDNTNPEWHEYDGKVPHTNHLHIELTREAGKELTAQQIRDLIKGGKYV